MPSISPENGYLTVINLFKTDTAENRERLVEEMRSVVDTAAFPGWISSTVHRGEDNQGTLNFIQWRGAGDLEARYAGDVFKHRTVPLFLEVATYARLMRTEVVSSQRHPASGETTEISPERDDYSVIEVLDTAPKNQGRLIATVGAGHEWLVDTPGYRSQSVLRGIGALGPEPDGQGMKPLNDNSFVVVYSQWDSKESYDAFRRVPEDQQSPARRRTAAVRYALTISSDWNTYRVVHSRSASQPVAA
jgi:quinol monooxygenase YgiN